ncbi:MAG: valine--tRNA ligase [Alphaproteobacteria bacterium]|nr:valine--tRNA ligase [Alphaproteobacteria bacterium]
MIEKTFTPKTVEGPLYQQWLDNDVFACDVVSTKPAYTVMMPPPNVTGALHIGHALNSTIQDVLVRFKRQMGFDVLWQPGTDHAGIATQFVVERQLKAQGMSRTEMGREKFLEKVWAWKEESGGTIFNQMQRLGISPDWKRARFTMDDGLSNAVRDVFVRLHRDGLIYKDTRLVNWDPSFQSAISDLEVINREVKGKMYHIAYALDTDPSTTLVIATTRPETMFGDTAVAVHPEDPRYTHLVGKMLRLPLTDRLIPIIADEHCDKDFGTGALKVTPAHDFNDFAIGKRHDLEFINILNPNGTLNDNVPEAFRGLLGDKARTATVTALEECGAVISVEDHKLSVPHSEKSDARVEPYLTEQWFVAMDKLTAPALAAVETGKTTFFPKQWENTYFEWLRNIQPWCISRQIWWGHQIPAWYGPDGHIFVEKTEEEAVAAAQKHYGKDVPLTQDKDVLDTWFSSALWPFSTLGWPSKTPELSKYYPTSVLVTGFDIIFFWVARMMMMGLYTQDKIPFEKIYIHALVRDEKGQKMSKTKGNVLDPLDLIEQYGADALRFTLAISAAPGRDIKIGPSKVENYRNFLTKIWNACRFLMMQEGWSYNPSFDPINAKLSLSQWIISHTARLSQDVKTHLDDFRFDLAAQALYHFIYDLYCDFFLEFMKPIMGGEDQSARTEILETAFWVFGEVLRMLQPFTPFVTQHLWEGIGASTMEGAELLCKQAWPNLDDRYININAEKDVDHMMNVIVTLRRLRAEYRVPPATLLSVKASHDALSNTLSQTLVKRMARLNGLDVEEGYVPTQGDVMLTVDNAPYYLKLGDSIDIEQERMRMTKELETLEKDMASANARLSNPEFISKAKDDVIETMKERVTSALMDIEQKKKALHFLKP